MSKLTCKNCEYVKYFKTVFGIKYLFCQYKNKLTKKSFFCYMHKKCSWLKRFIRWFA